MLNINESFFKFKLILRLEGNLAEKLEEDYTPREREDIDKAHLRLVKETEGPKSKAPSPSLSSRIRSFGKNIANIAKNTFDNSAGLGIAKYQNYKTTKEFKKGDGHAGKVVYLMHGTKQNEGSQWRLAKELRKNGYKPMHLKADHNISKEKNADNTFEQIGKFHKKAKIKNAPEREDHFSGHSSGADMGIYIAGDKRVTEYGIKSVQARAPAPYGIKAETAGQRILLPLIAPHDNLKFTKVKKGAVDSNKRKPLVPVNVYAGKNDTLVRPKDAYWKHANNMYVINHPDSTHFGTSGANKEMNQHFTKELGRKHGKRLPHQKLEYKVQQVYQAPKK